MESRKDFQKKIGQKKKGDFGKIVLQNEEIPMEEERQNVVQKSLRKVSPFKMKYDYQSSFRIGFEKKILKEEDK